MSRLKVLSPLQDFFWCGNDFELSSGIWIRRFDSQPNLNGLEVSLAESEQENMALAQHWLVFDWAESSSMSPGEMVNHALLSLWLIKPTQVHVAFRFEMGHGRKTFYRLLDRFSWIRGLTSHEFGTGELQAASAYYSPLREVCSARGRLNDALTLTFAGCWSHQWQVALICQSAAAEAVLSYSRAKGISQRLAKSFACLVESDKPNRDEAFKEFKAMYSARSDIMHGRTHNIAETDRLPNLAQFQEIVRRLWRVILSSPHLMKVLEGTDAQRETLFTSLQAEYTAPKLT